MLNYKSKILLVDDTGVVLNVSLSTLPVGKVHSVSLETQVKQGDSYDGSVVTPDPDAAKKAALEAEVKKAVAALQSADDKQAILKALSDAEAAVTPLSEVTL